MFMKIIKLRLRWLFKRQMYCDVCHSITMHELVYSDAVEDYSVYECEFCNRPLYSRLVNGRISTYKDFLRKTS